MLSTRCSFTSVFKQCKSDSNREKHERGGIIEELSSIWISRASAAILHRISRRPKGGECIECRHDYREGKPLFLNGVVEVAIEIRWVHASLVSPKKILEYSKHLRSYLRQENSALSTRIFRFQTTIDFGPRCIVWCWQCSGFSTEQVKTWRVDANLAVAVRQQYYPRNIGSFAKKRILGKFRPSNSLRRLWIFTFLVSDFARDE